MAAHWQIARWLRPHPERTMCRALQARAGASPRIGRGPRENLLRRPGRLQRRSRLQPRRDVPRRAADAPRVSLLHRHRHRRRGVHTAAGSIQGLHLVVDDIHAARKELIERGVDVGGVQDMTAPGKPAFSYAPFTDPDGIGWTLQKANIQLPNVRSRARPPGLAAPFLAGRAGGHVSGAGQAGQHRGRHRSSMARLRELSARGSGSR